MAIAIAALVAPLRTFRLQSEQARQSWLYDALMRVPILGFASFTNVYAPKSADVGIARGSNLEEAVRRAVKLAGGMDFIKEGQTVLIKPNVTGGLKSPTTTNAEVLYAVIKLAAERGPKRIIVSDRCF